MMLTYLKKRALFTYMKTSHLAKFNVQQCAAQYSTAQNQKLKVYDEISIHKKKNKIKPKPYEELLKVLEAREQTLHVQSRQSVQKLKENSSSISLGKDLFKSNASELNLDANDGIFTVKPDVKTRSKSTSENKTANEAKTKQSNKGNLVKAKIKKELSANQKEMLKTTKFAHAMKTLKSYIEVCINIDEVGKAHYAFERYLNKYETKSVDVSVYNMLISGWAQKGRLDKVKKIVSQMSENSISPNLQSYAGYLECIGRSKFLDISEIQHVVKEIKSKGFSCSDILHKCTFVADQKEKITEVLGFVESNLSTPSLGKESSIYSCELLNKLNDKSYGRGGRHLDLCFEEKDIPKHAANQMQSEIKYSLEIRSVDAITKLDAKVLKSRKYLKECEGEWRKKLTQVLKNIKSLEKRSLGIRIRKTSIYPYLAVIDTDILVDLLLQEVRLLSETGEFFSLNEGTMYKALGHKVMNHYFVWLNQKHKITDKVLFIYQHYLDYLLNPELCEKYTPREYWEKLKLDYSSGPSIDISHNNWPPDVLLHIGKYLYDILRNNIAFNADCVRHKAPSKVMSQAFYTAYEGMDLKLSKQIRTHSLLCKLYRDAKLENLVFDTTLVPMLSPPKPWVKHDSGGLLITTTPFIRFPIQATHQAARYSKMPSYQLNPCFDSLNSLSLCPWIINKPILDLVIDVFRNGGSDELEIPLNPSSSPSLPKFLPSMTKKEKAVIRRQKQELKKKKCEMTSLWYDCLYKLSIANHFRETVFWFPHNLDFRGRVYPTPPHFNHLGNDMARSILLFADGQPLGEKGLDWLKIHLINLTGFKKREPNEERLKYADVVMPEILDSADHPFEGRQWWKTSDKPWQTLACCKEIANAIRHPNPAEYVSHFPIHQDGSCNGLQHYAALGRDELGAIEVNLHPSTAPQDVYSGVAALVEKERAREAKEGLEVAKQLEGFVKRKVVKQTVMTFVYGVTPYGAKLQILKQLKDIPEFPEKYYHEAAIYLMKKTFFSIREMFTATKQIQDWFTECAEQITRISGDTLEWVTPVGLPVIQPYHKEVSVKSTSHYMTQIKEPQSSYNSKFEPYQLPNIRKQKNAFAPNFIHSLDSTHMMLTSLFCQRKGITFVSVHDCYWTHSSTVEIMNKICREQFVSLHKEPILEHLSAFFLSKYARVVDQYI
nr:DNA-directed RNA polymerase, mitochondrial-like isoform X2 [Parasteatoda tepidariorum]